MTDIDSAPAAQQDLPLFFKRPVPLDAVRHARAGLSPSEDLSFSAATNSIALNAVELAEAAKHYPIVFTQGAGVLPAAVLGLEQHNYFLQADGRWNAGAYVPAYVRKYPFIFMDVPERNQLVLCVDEEAPQYRAAAGEGSQPLYEGEQPSALARHALGFCTAFQHHYQLTRAFCEALQAADLLTSTRSDATLFNGREILLAGFQVIDEEKFNALPEKRFLEFRAKGWLPLIYFTLMSASNWQRLTQMAGEREGAIAPASLG